MAYGVNVDEKGGWGVRSLPGAFRISAMVLLMLISPVFCFSGPGAGWNDLPGLSFFRKEIKPPQEFSLPPFPETLREVEEDFPLAIPSYLKLFVEVGIKMTGADPEKNVCLIFPAEILSPPATMAVARSIPESGGREKTAGPKKPRHPGDLGHMRHLWTTAPEHIRHPWLFGGIHPVVGIGPSEQITVLNANMWLLPEPVPIRQYDRMRVFLDLIGSCTPDVLVLQEVWLLSYVDFLRRHLPGYWCVFPKYDVYNHSGLVIFSKFPPQSAQFGNFGRSLEHNVVEQFANKGFLQIQVSLPGLSLNILDTHLYASRGQMVEREITRRQLLSLRILGNMASETLILCGDLNTGTEEVKNVLGGLFTLEPDLTTTTQAKKNGRKIDYVMVKPGNKIAGSIESKVVKEPFVSDHLPVMATLTFTIKP